MIDRAALAALSERLIRRSGTNPCAAWDSRIDGSALAGASEAGLLHVKHQALLRAYQSRYVLLPDGPTTGSTVAGLRRHYDPAIEIELAGVRRLLERELIEPEIEAARASASDLTLDAYVETMVEALDQAPENSFTAYLRTSPDRTHHYRNFLLQSSVDLLAEASASAFGVIGEFGPPQSALFRILIDEFGYGAHDRKHSVLYRALMRDFGLPEAYNACWPLFDTAALALHNTIHCLFQNPGHILLQVGFLLFAETAYQRSTGDHFRYLSEFHPQADSRYFREHAHIDLHHARMIVEEVARPLIATYGPEAGGEIIAGAELTRRAFQTAGDQLLAVTRAFDLAAGKRAGVFGAPSVADLEPRGGLVTPGGNLEGRTGPVTIQVGAIGRLSTAGAFAAFPAGAIGRTSSGGE